MSGGLLTLAALASRPLWVGWQVEDREDGKPTKVPYGPDGRKARADAPETWGDRPAAERCAAALPKPYGVGGVGLEFTSLGDGRSLAGIDLDSCRDPTSGTLDGWAENVIAGFDTYVETSPSGTGAKAFFTFDTDALPSLQACIAPAKLGRQFKRAGGEHPPSIELYLGARFFAVTDMALPGSRHDIRHVDAERIRRLIQVDGPAFVASGQSHPRDPAGGMDRSRSAAAFRVGKRAVQSGADFDAMCDALRADPDTSGWMREKGEANRCREARRIFAKAADAGPLIRIAGGELHNIATAGEAAILTAGLAIYQRGNSLVRPVVQDVPASRGRMTVAAALHDIGGCGLVDALCGCATWERFDARAKDWVRVNPPRDVADTILSRAGSWTLPKVVGVTTTPTIRPDGSILSAPGYDPATRLYHAADQSLVLDASVQAPTRASALEALHLLNGLLVDFPFVITKDGGGKEKEVARAVALSGLITPTVRGALTVAPLHVFRANTAGSGKSYLVDLASAISSGRPCPVASAGPDEAETEKRLTGLLLAGFPIASMDNVNGELGGDLLCQAIERPLIRLRPLGRSDIVEIESRATLYATGNSLRVRGDMVRRTLVCDIDAGEERPELRSFRGDPIASVMADRGRYVSACLAIVRAYLLAGQPERATPIASFADWSAMVRSALIWLGCADPADSMDQAREDDPELGELRELLPLWFAAFGHCGKTTREVAEAAGQRLILDSGSYGELAFPDLYDALLRIAGERGSINNKRFGRWLMNREGRIVGGLRLKRDDTRAHGGVVRWTVGPVVSGGFGGFGGSV